MSSSEGQALAPLPPQQYVRHERMYDVAKHDLMYAAHLWDQFASMKNIKYGFVGALIAVLRNRDCEIFDLEIVVEPSAMDNYAERLTEIAREYPQYFAVTPFNHHIVVVRENKGVAFQCAALGSPGYPHEFIEPYDSWLRPAEHFNLAPTFYRQSLGYAYNDRAVPIFISRLLILQRLCQFNSTQLKPNPTKEDKERNIRQIHDIKAFLIFTYDDHEPPFHNDQVPWLLPLVRQWIKFAENNFVGTSGHEVLMWQILGIPLTSQDVSALLR